jgi:hypothetical protein
MGLPIVTLNADLKGDPGAITNLVVGPPFRWNGLSIEAAGVFPTRPFERSGLAFGFGHRRFACGIFVSVIQCSDPRLAINQRLLSSLEVSYFQAATIQIP